MKNLCTWTVMALAMFGVSSAYAVNPPATFTNASFYVIWQKINNFSKLTSNGTTTIYGTINPAGVGSYSGVTINGTIYVPPAGTVVMLSLPTAVAPDGDSCQIAASNRLEVNNLLQALAPTYTLGGGMFFGASNGPGVTGTSSVTSGQWSFVITSGTSGYCGMLNN